jgi:pimeloyl-ACP methyl ester carboxylesterase
VARLCVPVCRVAGHDDRYVSTGWQSVRLYRALPGSTLRIVAGAGHMVHHAAPEEIAGAVREVARERPEARTAPSVRPMASARP